MVDLKEMELVDKNVMLTLTEPYEHNFHCECGANVFSEYKDKDGKKYYSCHGCNAIYDNGED